MLVETLGNDFPRLQHIWADQGSAGALRQWIAERLGIDLEVVYPWWRQLQRYRPDLLEEMGFQPGFPVLPRRWVVEQTQPHYLQSALDDQPASAHDKPHGVAQPA